MNELEKCMAGECYNCHDKIFTSFKASARKLLAEYHALAYEQKEEKTAVLKRLFHKVGTNVSVASPFLCDYGRNISIGNHVSVNMNCTFVDCNVITIGDNVLSHPMSSFIPQPIPWNWRKGSRRTGILNRSSTFAALTRCRFGSETAAGSAQASLSFRA